MPLQSRYTYSKIISNTKKINSDGSQRVVPRLFMMLYPDFEDKVKDIYVYAVDGDRLDLMAYDFYGREDLWFVIASANNVGKGTLFVEPGQILRIPFYDEYGIIVEEVKFYNESR